MSNSIKILWDIFDKKKKRNVLENKNWSFTQKHIDQVLSWELVNPKNIKDKPRDNTAINLSINTLLKKQWIDFKDLEWKKVIDIWWGFTELPFLLEWIRTELNIVDPIYSFDVQREIFRNKDKIYSLIKKFDDHNYDAYKKWENQDYYYKLNEEFNFILSWLRKWEKLDWTDKVNLDWADINILPITWEEIDLEDESIDYIFINHTITKIPVNPYILLEKAYKLLKIWWKVYITEAWIIDVTKFKLSNTEFKIEEKHISLEWRNENTILILEKI